jgi:hypothetical protein
MQVTMGWAVTVGGITVKELRTLDRAENVAEEWELKGYEDVELMEVEL